MVVNTLENNVFDDLPLLLAVPHAAQLLGISRASSVPPCGLRRAASAPARRSRLRPDIGPA